MTLIVLYSHHKYILELFLTCLKFCCCFFNTVCLKCSLSSHLLSYGHLSALNMSFCFQMCLFSPQKEIVAVSPASDHPEYWHRCVSDGSVSGVSGGHQHHRHQCVRTSHTLNVGTITSAFTHIPCDFGWHQTPRFCFFSSPNPYLSFVTINSSERRPFINSIDSAWVE